LIAKRLSFDRIGDVLDVGCGIGHWGQLLAKILPDSTRVWGIDRDPLWAGKAAERACLRGLASRFAYYVSVAEKLPFTDSSFDLVTCQTLLIHARDPVAVLNEMIRVTRPGGLVLAAEPNNMAGALLLDSVGFHDSIETIMALARLQLACERGKWALGEGSNSIGGLVPGLFAENGLADIRVYLNDKASPILPPYSSPEQRAILDEIASFRVRDFWIWSLQDTHRYFMAGGGRESEFERLWTIAVEGGARIESALGNGTYSCAGGSVSYLVAGRKPDHPN
jgi:SAM-dependent methyltransferase